MNALALLAVLTSTSFVSALIWLVVMGLIFWVLWWFLNYIKPPDPFGKVCRVLLALAAVVLIINVLLSLIGRSFIQF